MERARLIGGLARMLRDLTRAEDLAQDALVAALATWPETGIPANPGAWLMATARRRAVDHLRHDRMRGRKLAELAQTPAAAVPDHDGLRRIARAEAAMDDDLGDEVLGLIFTACHPVLTREARAALTLRLIGGLATDEIARAFLVKEATMAQRLVRARKTLSAAGLAWEIPRGPALAPRLASVLEVIYLIFNEGYAATAGPDLTRPALCAEARRLGRVLAAAMPADPEVLGLKALMDIQASRLAARIAPDGSAVPLDAQDRRRWDRLLISQGLDALAQAEGLAWRLAETRGPYTLQAALAACHARAPDFAATDWMRIAGLYDDLELVMPSPVVTLNRAVAHGMAHGPEAGLAIAMTLATLPALAGYAPLPAVIGDLLCRAGRKAEAREHFVDAAGLTRNARERFHLLARAAACGT
ncbi:MULTISPECIES: RNA polymerase sigma factor [Tistrella]|uniref:RNA polymerase sigma factor n=1 Tax=Tistrella TaxID=171436 RepID=UPI0031F628A9